MKTKRSKLLITVLSVAAIGLSSAALQAGGDQQQLRHSNAWGQNLEGVELSEGLQDMIKEFRQTRERLMQQYREAHLAFREDMAPLITELKALDENSESYEADRKAIMDQIEAKRAEHRAEFGTEFREARVEMRQMKRRLREQIREERTPPPEEG